MESAPPTLGDQLASPAEPLPRSALKYANIQSLAGLVLALFGIALVALLVPVDWVAFVALVVLLPLSVVVALVDVCFLNRIQHRSYRYAVSSAALETSSGALLRSRSVISPIQILSIDTLQGPLLRVCGLAILVFQTVGGPVRLGPVSPDTAAEIRKRVLAVVETAAG